MGELVKSEPSVQTEMRADDPDVVLTSAVGHFSKVLVVGYTKSGEIDAFGSLNFSNEQIVFAMERFKHKIMAGDHGPEDMA